MWEIVPDARGHRVRHGAGSRMKTTMARRETYRDRNAVRVRSAEGGCHHARTEQASFKFNGRSTDFAARVVKVVGKNLTLRKRHFYEIGCFDIVDDGERTRASEHLARAATKARFGAPGRI